MKNSAIEIYRVFLCLWVILFHYSTRYDSLYGHVKSYGIDFYHGGLAAVAMFFILSGYFVGNYVSKIESTNIRIALKFWLRKVLNLYPAYFCCVITIFVFLNIFYLPVRGNVDIITFVINLMFPFHPGVNYLDGAHWYISALLVAITIVSAFIAFDIQKKKEPLCILLLVLYLFSFIDLPYINILNSHLFFDRIVPFFWGYFFSLYKTNREGFFLLIASSPLMLFSFGNLICALLCILIFIFFVGEKQKEFFYKNPIMLFWGKFGSYTYVWYLLHQNIGYAIIYNMEKKGYIAEYFLVIPIFFTFSLSIVIVKFFIPFINKLFLPLTKKIL